LELRLDAQLIPPGCIVWGIGLFMSVYKRYGELESNEQLEEAEKEIGDGQYVVKTSQATKFSFREDEM
jgi:hypothetical protein